ncbi:MAG: cytochrome B [Methylophilaceae bacterium]|nr:cytochrome B [Methylophilaceae bacterium]
MLQRILVWDVPTRVFHWAFALSFAGAFLTAETERYRDIHLALGYLFLGLIAFRVIWGFVGTRYARFSAFLFKPIEIFDYLKSLLNRQPRHYVGHNPAGSVAIFLLLGLGLFIGISGVLLDFDIGGEVYEELHELAANLMLAVVVVHIAGVAISSWLHRENLVRSMITGYKDTESEPGIRRAYVWLGVIMATLIAAFLLLYQPGSLFTADNTVQTTQQED